MNNEIRQIESKICEIRGLESQINKFKEYLNILQPKVVKKKKNDPEPMNYDISINYEDKAKKNMSYNLGNCSYSPDSIKIKEEYYDIFIIPIKLIISDLEKKIAILELEIK